MKIINIKLLHSCMRILYLMFRVVSFCLYLMLSYKSSILEATMNIFNYASITLLLEIDLSPNSILFISVVRLITSVVIVFSLSYITAHFHSLTFYTLLNLFVISMLFVISFKNLFVVMLGWDGLGVISFFLILNYHSPYRIFSAWFTILINRLGDRFLILSLTLIFYLDNLSSTFLIRSFLLPISLKSLLLIGFITKRAIFPFSPWLPIAIRAPTPISSLVHSSTLVTAGLYLIIRIESLIFSNINLCVLIIWLCIFTTLYAGLSALVETDLKKLVALSTLSHLGFIGISLSRGMLNLAYFHLLAHALFKRLIFISVGDWILSGHHYQDSRSLSGGYSLTPYSSLVTITSILRLMGIPFMVGFYSKDYILESLFYSSYSLVYILIVYFNVFLTFIYTLRVLGYVSLSLNQSSPLLMLSHSRLIHYVIMSFLSVVSIFFPLIYSVGFDLKAIVIVPLFQTLPPLLLVVSFILYYINLYKYELSLNSSMWYKYAHFSFRYIVNMGVLYSSIMSLVSFKLNCLRNKTIELGLLSSISQLFIEEVGTSVSNSVLKIVRVILPITILLVLILMIWVLTVG